ncbi:MAG: hypothetical protein GX874_04325 [Smithella sp.]|nr:hypothetical protein [Smithella sp.]
MALSSGIPYRAPPFSGSRRFHSIELNKSKTGFAVIKDDLIIAGIHFPGPENSFGRAADDRHDDSCPFVFAQANW